MIGLIFVLMIYWQGELILSSEYDTQEYCEIAKKDLWRKSAAEGLKMECVRKAWQ